MADPASPAERYEVWSGRLNRSYALAHFGKSLFWYQSEFLFTFFLIRSLSVSPRDAAFVLASGLLASAILDMTLGAGLRARLNAPVMSSKLQMLGAFGGSLGLYLLLSSRFVPPAHSLSLAFLGTMVFRVSYEFHEMGQDTLLSLFPLTDKRQGDRLVGLRMIGSGAAALLVGLAIGLLLGWGEGSRGAHRTALFLCFSMTPLLSVGSAIWLWRDTNARFARSAVSRRTGRDTARSRDRAAAISRAPFYVAIFFSAWIGPCFARTLPFLAQKHDAQTGLCLLACYPLGIILAQPLWTQLASRHEERRLLTILCGILAAMVLVRPLVLASGDAILSGCAVFFFGGASGCLGAALWSGFAYASRSCPGGIAQGYGRYLACAKSGLAMMTLSLATGVSFSPVSMDPVFPDIQGLAACAILGGSFIRALRPARTRGDRHSYRRKH